MGEQRAAPRPPRAQLPRHGTQPVAARCGARPARGWSSCGEPGDPPGGPVLLIPAHSLCPRPVWSGARGGPGVIVCVRLGFFGKLLFGIRDSGWTLHCAVLGSEKPLLPAWGVATAPGLALLFPPQRMGTPGCLGVPGALETGLEGGDLVLPLCRFPSGWRESGCNLMLDSVHVPGSPAFLSGQTVPGPCRPCLPQLAPIKCQICLDRRARWDSRSAYFVSRLFP